MLSRNVLASVSRKKEGGDFVGYPSEIELCTKS